MKKILLLILALLAISCISVSVALAEESTTLIYTADDLLSAGDGNYKLAADITLPAGRYVNAFYGNLDGDGHTVRIDNGVGLFKNLGSPSSPATVVNLIIEGSVSGGDAVGGVAQYAVGRIEGVTVRADVSSTSRRNVGGFANCNGRNSLVIKDCVLEGSVTLSQGFTAAGNYTYWGTFLGYNGGAYGGGRVEDGTIRYTFTIPTSETARIKAVEFFNDNDTGNKKSGYTTRTVGENTVFTFDCVLSIDPVTIESVNDEGIMAHYGSPVVRFTLEDGSYRYLDGMDRANASFRTDFSAAGFNEMYKYSDISNLVVRKVSHVTYSGDDVIGGGSASVTSTYSEVTVYTAQQFESFARMVNSAIPARFRGVNGEEVNLSILDTLAVSVKLGGDIDLTVGDENGNKSQFYGLGKQEFFPYRGGIDGDGHTLTVDIDAPNGYCVGVISVSSEMIETIKIKDLTLAGSIRGRTKVGLVGYFDMVCNAYVRGGKIEFSNVTNAADITGYAAVGGLLGATSNSDDCIKVSFSDCTNSGNVTLLDGGKYVGGILGVAGFYNDNAGADMTNCTNAGTVTALPGADFAGGLAGYIGNDLSAFKDVSSSGEVTADEGMTRGFLIGRTGAIKIDAGEGDIGSFIKSSPSEVYAAGFTKSRMSSVYGDAFTVFITGKITPNYAINATFTDLRGNRVIFGTGENIRDELTADGGALTVLLEPGEYTIGLVARYADGYYNVGDIEDGRVLEATATYVVSKRTEIIFIPTDPVSAPYTGERVDYLEALAGADLGGKTTLSDTDENTGAKWVVEYYLNGNKAEEARASGRYDVRLRIEATDLYRSRYDYPEETFEGVLVIRHLITVKVVDMDITRGKKAVFRVEITSYDGGVFTDTAALNLTFTIRGFAGVTNTALLPLGSYYIDVEGVSSFGDYDIEYVGGRLVVKPADSSGGSSDSSKPDDSGSTSEYSSKKKGCRGGLEGVGAWGLAAAAILFIKKKTYKSGKRI